MRAPTPPYGDVVIEGFFSGWKIALVDSGTHVRRNWRLPARDQLGKYGGGPHRSYPPISTTVIADWLWHWLSPRVQHGLMNNKAARSQREREVIGAPEETA